MLSEKLLERTRQELLDLHKRVLLNYLIGIGLEYKTRKKFFILYSTYIDTDNINQYFFVPCQIFVKALVKDSLDKIAFTCGFPNNSVLHKVKIKRKHKKCTKI